MIKHILIERNQAGSREGLVLLNYAIRKDIPYSFESVLWGCTEGVLPYGGITWMEGYLGCQAPDYYPSWASAWLKRRVFPSKEPPCQAGIFIKPADRYKRFTGFVTKNAHKGRRHGPFMCSEKVHFRQEWRYLIADGQVLTGDWYDGEDSSEPAPELPVQPPAAWCGALDFGRLASGELALVEAQHPYSIGWYGPPEKDELFVYFLYAGWKYLLNSKKPR